MSSYRILGDQGVKDEFTQAHCTKLHQWFDSKGTFLPASTPPSSRERLWNTISLLTRAEPADIDLANQIIVHTGIDSNHFQPIVVPELLLRFGDKLEEASQEHLKATLHAHVANILEVCFGGLGTHNFSGMSTFCMLLGSQFVDTYEWNHPLGSIPAVYTGDRLRTAGMAALHGMAHMMENEDVAHEFNSPTYSAITAHMMAKIVELVDDEEARSMALQIELALWRELLALYHPELGLNCGPWSRAYRVDVLGQNSQMRFLMCYLGLSKDRSIVELLDESQEGLIFHHDGDIPFTWSGPAWQLASRFHVPEAAIEELQEREYPHVFRARASWERFGAVKNGKWISVQGGALPGGETTICQIQDRNHAIGYRTANRHSHSFPLSFHYALKPAVETMFDVRNILIGVSFFGAPEEWVQSQRGGRMEASNFNHGGPSRVRQKGESYIVESAFYPQMSVLPADELSVNVMMPVHQGRMEKVMLNGECFQEEAIEITASEGTLLVEDAGFVYEVVYRFPGAVTMRLYAWANFIRFAGFWYKGEPRRHEAAYLAGLSGTCTFRLLEEPPAEES